MITKNNRLTTTGDNVTIFALTTIFKNSVLDSVSDTQPEYVNETLDQYGATSGSNLSSKRLHSQ